MPLLRRSFAAPSPLLSRSNRHQRACEPLAFIVLGSHRAKRCTQHGMMHSHSIDRLIRATYGVYVLQDAFLTTLAIAAANVGSRVSSTTRPLGGPSDTSKPLQPSVLPRRSGTYSIVAGAECEEGYLPVTFNWRACYTAAVALGFGNESVCCIAHHYKWGSTRPRGCFQSAGNHRIHFNRGVGGDAYPGDSIICRLKGTGRHSNGG